MSRGYERNAERVRIDAFVKVRGAGDDLMFRTRDLSIQGVFLYTPVAGSYPFKVGSTLDLELTNQASQVVCTGVVVRVVEPGSGEAAQYPTGFGVRITAIDEPNRERLVAMIKSAE